MAHVGNTEATMAGEDFSFIARTVPSCFIFLGTRNESIGAGMACNCTNRVSSAFPC
jgi:metal-dependent amidase/aminoacylase/carboxypeptidase family protein